MNFSKRVGHWTQLSLLTYCLFPKSPWVAHCLPRHLESRILYVSLIVLPFHENWNETNSRIQLKKRIIRIFGSNNVAYRQCGKCYYIAMFRVTQQDVPEPLVFIELFPESLLSLSVRLLFFFLKKMPFSMSIDRSD